MFRLKKFFFSACVTLLLTFVLTVPGFALVSVDDVPYAYVQLNSGSPIYCTGSLPLWLSSSNVALTSYALYIPFTDVADSFDINLNLVSGVVTSYGTFSASYGTLQGSKYTQVGILPSPVRKAAPQSTITSGKYKIGSFLSVDCSSVSSVPENCFINSRSFKSNFDAPFISRLLTSRHVRANLILTSQRSGMVDKLMRDCCNVYVSCQKIWRFEILRYYDAYAVETAQEPSSVAPLRRTGYFIKDSMFDSYDTFSMVQALEKSCKDGDMLSDEEILNLRVGDSLSDARASFKRQARKRKKARKSR